MNIKDFAEKYIKAITEAWQNGNFDLLQVIEDTNVKYHLAGGQEGTGGFEGHKQFLATSREALSEFKQEWKYLTGDGNVFVVSVKMSGRIKKEIPVYQVPVGKFVSNDSMFVFRLGKGKIVESWESSSSVILD